METKPTHIPADQFIAEKSDQWRLNRTVTIRGNGTEGRKYEREAFTWFPETDSDDCVYVIERLGSGEKTMLRLAYWIVSRHGAMSGKWVFGRFCPMIPEHDLNALLAKARSEGTIK